MNNLMKKALVAEEVSLLFATSLGAATLEVAPGAGALEKAQAEVRALRAAHPDEPVTVTLAPGEYLLADTFAFGAADSGRPGAPVVWRGTPGTILRGGVDIGPWTDEGNGVVSAAIPKGADGKTLVVDILFVNGVRAERSILPKKRDTFKIPGGKEDSWTEVISSVTNELRIGAHTYEIVRYAREYTRLNEDAAKVLDAVPADELKEVQLQVLLDWSQARRRIVGWDRAKRLVLTECFGNPVRHDQYRWCDRSRIRFENLRAGFTDPGDWLYDAKNGKILYRLRAGETAATLTASAPARRLSKLLYAKGAHDLRFENLAFELADATAANGDDPAKHTQIWQGQSAQTSDATVYLEYCTDVTLANCRVARTGNYGFRIGTGCRCVTLSRCETWDTGAGAVWLGADEIYPPRNALKREIIREMYPESCASNVIADCTFRHGGRFNPEGTAIFVTYASDNLITHNRIDDFFYSGITLGYIWGYKGSPTQRNEVSFNHITKIGQAELFDLACIYTLSASYGTVISNNVVSAVGGHGIYMDEGSEGILIENNLCTHLEEAGAFMHFGTGCTFRNNIFAYNAKYGLAWASKRESFKVPSSINFLGNIFLTEDAPLIGPRTLGVDGVRAHNVWWNPRFGEKGTLKLKGKVEVEGVRRDFDGLTAEEYLAQGKAYGDIIADPLFVDPKGGDFRLKPDSPARKIGFREWDLSSAGPRPTPLADLGMRYAGESFPLEPTGDATTWYALTFEAKSVTNGYWWVDLLDAKGGWVSDVNSRLEASADFRRYEVFVPARFDVAVADVSFVSRGKVEARSIALRRVPAAKAAAHFRAIAAENPPVRDCASADSWSRLPKTREALRSGRELTVVFLGDSIMNDTWCGGVDPFLREAFPKARLRNILSICSGGGCWIFHDAAKFAKFVTRFKPDLLVIGGICNKNPSKEGKSAEDCMVEVIERARKIGAEVVVCTPGKSHDPRVPSPDPNILRKDYILRAAARTNIPCWDLTDGPVEAVRGSDRPVGYFNRDRVHNNDRGKTLNATAMVQHFRAAKLAAEQNEK